MAEANLINKKAGSDTETITPKTGKQTILCRCPKCGADHKMRMHWIGRGRPRKYCPLCRNNLKSVAGNLYVLDLRKR